MLEEMVNEQTELCQNSPLCPYVSHFDSSDEDFDSYLQMAVQELPGWVIIRLFLYLPISISLSSKVPSWLILSFSPSLKGHLIWQRKK